MSYRYFMPSFVEICPLVPEKKIFEGIYHIWTWQPSWSCDLDYLYIHIDNPFLLMLHNKIDQAVSEEKMFEYYGDIRGVTIYRYIGILRYGARGMVYRYAHTRSPVYRNTVRVLY